MRRLTLSALARAALVGALIALTAAVVTSPGGEATAERREAARSLPADDGPAGRFGLDGRWLLRRDRRDVGLRQRWYRSPPLGGWRRVTVPNAWNARDLSSASMRGGVVWYRRDFRLPDERGGLDWLVHFDSVRYRATVWLNGRRMGGHAGAYLPWEVRLRGVSRTRTNRLVVRVDNRPRATDLPVANTTLTGQPNGGWWNWGGILGQVYLRRVDRIDVASVQVLPRLPCRSCPAALDLRAAVRDYGPSAPVRVTALVGGRRVSLGSARIAHGRTHAFRTRVVVDHPRLWSPPHPNLYPVTVAAAGAGGSASWSLRTGIRSVSVRGGRLLLNWRPVHFRGVFLHQDSPARGGAVTHARMRLFVRLARRLGATVLRTHYPLDPYLHELADREGLMIWSEIPVYQLHTRELATRAVQRHAAAMLRANILANGSHPSVLTWSIGNELNAWPGAVEARYFRRQAALAHRLDPTRPLALAIQGIPSGGCQRAYRPIQLLGVNSYFGWYDGPSRELAGRRGLSAYLDSVRRCYRRQAIAVTEFGAEANRAGPAREKGTYAFQSRLIAYHLGVYARKPWLAGAIGMLMTFRVRPGWSGGNPRPNPPNHEKGVFDIRGRPKPAAAVMARWFHRTRQYGEPGR